MRRMDNVSINHQYDSALCVCSRPAYWLMTVAKYELVKNLIYKGCYKLTVKCVLCENQLYFRPPNYNSNQKSAIIEHLDRLGFVKPNWKDV